MAIKKEILGSIKLQIPAGQANPSPPVGPALGQYGLNIMDFCKAFNEKTKGQEGAVIPVIITVYVDRTYTFIIKTPLTSFLLKQAAKIAKGSGEPNRNKVGQVPREQTRSWSFLHFQKSQSLTRLAITRKGHHSKVFLVSF